MVAGMNALSLTIPGMSPDATMHSNLWRRPQITQVDEVWTVEGRPQTSGRLLRMEQPSNIPGKTYVATLVTVPPNSATPPHTHNGAAVYAQVIKGKVVSQMIHHQTVTKPDGTTEVQEHDSSVGVYESGEMWYEAPGCRHVRAENAGKEEAAFYANFIIDTAKSEGIDPSDPKSLGSVLTILDVNPRSPYYVAEAAPSS